MLPHETTDIKEKSNLSIKETDNIGVLYGIINSNAEIKIKIIHKFIPKYINEYNVWIVGTDDYDVLVDGSNLNTIPGTKHYVIYSSFDKYGVTKYYDRSRSNINLYGLVNYKGVVLTDPKYTKITAPLENGVRISIKPDGGSSIMEHMGILDHNGKEITEFKYTKILPFEDNDDLYELGYTNESSVYVTEYCDYKGNIYSDVNDALASLKKEYIKEENGGVSTMFGFINSDGDIILPIIYQNISKPYDSNIYMISNWTSYAIFDLNLNQLTDFIYANEHIHFNRFGTTVLKKGKIGHTLFTLQNRVLIDKDGNELTNTENIYTNIYNSNSFGVRRALKKITGLEVLWGLLGNDGKEIIEFKYDSITPMHIDGTYEMQIRENGKNILKYCNYRGEIFDTPEDVIKSMDEQINENNIPVLTKFGIIESSCKFIIPIECHEIVHEKRIDRYIIKKEHSQQALFDENLNRLTDFFYYIERFDPIHNTAVFLKNEFGTMDADGNVVISPKYFTILGPDVYGTRIAKYGHRGSYGLVDKNGNEITKFIYDYIDKFNTVVVQDSGVYKLYELCEDGTNKITYASHRGNIYNAVVDAIKDNKIVESISNGVIVESTLEKNKVKYDIINEDCYLYGDFEFDLVYTDNIGNLIYNSGDLWGILNPNLDRLFDIKAHTVSPFYDITSGLYRCKKFNGKILVYDSIKDIASREYDVILPFKSSKMEPLDENICIASINNKWCVLDSNFNEITNMIYDGIGHILIVDSGITIARKGTYKGLLNIHTGEELTKIIYDETSFNSTDKIITLKIKKSSNPKTHYYHINTGELNDKYW